MTADRDDLLGKATRNSASITFRELCLLAECYGFRSDRQKGSHHIYVRDGVRPQDFQPRKSDPKMAKPYQVKQLLGVIAALSEK